MTVFLQFYFMCQLLKRVEQCLEYPLFEQRNVINLSTNGSLNLTKYIRISAKFYNLFTSSIDVSRALNLRLPNV